MSKVIKKVFLGVKSILFYVISKIKFGKRISMSKINSMKGRVNIELQSNSSCNIGSFLMTAGPLYVKCTEGGVLKVGDRCFFNHNCSITCADNITIGNRCMFANNLVVVDHDHKISDGQITGELESKEIFVGNNVWCGANVTILKGVTIGDGAVIAAGAVVNRDVAAHSLAGGVPAVEIKKLVN